MAETKAPRTFYMCSECGCTDIEAEYWVRLNTIRPGKDELAKLAGIDPRSGEEVGALVSSSEGNIWCPECESHSKGCCEIEKATGKCIMHGRELHDIQPKPYNARLARSG